MESEKIMTREEAKQIVAAWLASSEGEKDQCGYIEGWFYERDAEAFRMAIEALEQEQPEIIRCKDCKHVEYTPSSSWKRPYLCRIRSKGLGYCQDDGNGFCPYGERKESDEE